MPPSVVFKSRNDDPSINVLKATQLSKLNASFGTRGMGAAFRIGLVP